MPVSECARFSSAWIAIARCPSCGESSVAALATDLPPERILLSSSWEYRASVIAQLTEIHEEEIWFWKQQNARKRAAGPVKNACAVFDFGLVLRSKCRCAGLCGVLTYASRDLRLSAFCV